MREATRDSEVCVDGERSMVEDLQLEDLLEIVRGPERAAHSG